MPSSSNPTPMRDGRELSSVTADAPQIAELKTTGRYHLLRLLGRGGMSEVYLGFDPKQRQNVAIKILSRELSSSDSYVSRFIYEGRLSRELHHPYLVKGLDVGIDSETGRRFLVLEYIDGPTVQHRLEVEGKLPVAEALRVTLQIAYALEYLHHQKFVHRDVKPGNILLGSNGIAKLADLGVAKYLPGATELTTLDQGIGTPYYMPWEQTLNASLVDPRSDLFALGATLYHMVSGHVPFPGEDDASIAARKEEGSYIPVHELNPELPIELDRILSRLLARDPRKRFDNVRELIDVLTASGLKDGDLPSRDPDTDVQSTEVPTRVDLEKGQQTPLVTTDEIVWHLGFRTRSGTLKRLRGRTREVIEWLAEGLIPRHTVATPQGQKQFRRLSAYPEFRSILTELAQEAKASTRKAPVVPQADPGNKWTPLQLGLVGFVAVSVSLFLIYCLISKLG